MSRAHATSLSGVRMHLSVTRRVATYILNRSKHHVNLSGGKVIVSHSHCRLPSHRWFARVEERAVPTAAVRYIPSVVLHQKLRGRLQLSNQFVVRRVNRKAVPSRSNSQSTEALPAPAQIDGHARSPSREVLRVNTRPERSGRAARGPSQRTRCNGLDYSLIVRQKTLGHRRLQARC